MPTVDPDDPSGMTVLVTEEELLRDLDEHARKDYGISGEELLLRWHDNDPPQGVRCCKECFRRDEFYYLFLLGFR